MFPNNPQSLVAKAEANIYGLLRDTICYRMRVIKVNTIEIGLQDGFSAVF